MNKDKGPAAEPSSDELEESAERDEASRSWNNLTQALFDFPHIIAQLIEGWAPPELVESLDLHPEAIVRQDTTYINALFKVREGDRLYRISQKPAPCGDAVTESGLYIWMLLEFQRKPDRWMAVRMLGYVAALYDRLVREKQTNNGKLPPVFLFVQSQSDGAWSAPTSLSELIHLPKTSPLWHWQPRIEYYLLEEYNAEVHEEFSLLTGLLRAPHKSAPDEDFRRVLDGARATDHIEYKRFLIRWLYRMIPGADTDPRLVQEMNPMDALYDIGQRTKRWEEHLDQTRRVAREEGIEVGRSEGRSEGRTEGLEVGQRATLVAAIRLLHATRFSEVSLPVLDDLPLDDLQCLMKVAVTSDSLEAFSQHVASLG